MGSLIELLVKVELIDERQHDAVVSRAKSRAGGHIVQQIAELGYASEGAAARAISVELGLPRIDLSTTPVDPAALALLDLRTCAERFMLPVALRENGEVLWLAVADPTDKDAIELIRRRTQKRVRPAVAAPTEILRAARAAYAAAPASSAPEPVEVEKLEPVEGSLDDLLAAAPLSGDIADDLSDDDLATIDALRLSVEKGAHILRSLAELCVEKRVFARDEMKRRTSRP